MSKQLASLRPPILFLIGFPRSGTTWIANIIASHPDTLYRHEIIGRDYKIFGEALFQALKFNEGLTDDEFYCLYRHLLRARVATDKPPFFPKRFRKINSPTIQKLGWLTAKAFPVLEPIWSKIYTPSPKSNAKIVIKETRSSANLHSIIKGLRATKMLHIVRNPYAVVASHVEGQTAGAMAPDNRKSRELWYQNYQHSEYLSNSNMLREDQIYNMPYTEFIALKWRAENEAYQSICEKHEDGHIVLYEDFLKHPELSSKAMFANLGLDFDDQVQNFLGASASNKNQSGILEKTL